MTQVWPNVAHPYIPTQSPEENWSDYMQNHQADSPLYVLPDVWSADLHLLIFKSIVIRDTECPYWDQVSLNNTNQTKPNVTQAANYWHDELVNKTAPPTSAECLVEG